MVKKLLLGLAIALYFASTLWLSFGVPLTFTSPDENANFFFAESFRSFGTLAISDDVAGLLDGTPHPRSTVVVGSAIVPGSFIGLPLLAGVLGRVVGAAGMQYLTPLLLLAALAAWFDLLRRLTKSLPFAAIATALFALHPAVWYYASRPMMHNVGFVCLLVLAVWAVCAKPFSRGLRTAAHLKRAEAVEFFLGGLLLGVALIFRTSEALWIAAGVAFAAVQLRHHMKSKLSFLFLLAGLLIPLAVNGIVNNSLYGSPFVSGYTATSSDSSMNGGEMLYAAPASSILSDVVAVLLPFGFHERAMLNNVWNFGLALFPWMTVLAAAGLLLSLWTKGPWRRLAVGTLLLAAWLGMVYGSWSFNDNPDPTAVTLGDSHVRYWLPLFVLSTLFAARAVLMLSRSGPPGDTAGHRVTRTILLAVGVLSTLLVFSGDDGLVRTRQVLFASAEKREAVVALTEEDAIIVVDRADKFLWPYRRVIQPLRSEGTYAVLPQAVRFAPLYYFGIPFPEVDMTYLNEVKLAGLGLRIDFVAAIGDEALYRITPR